MRRTRLVALATASLIGTAGTLSLTSIGAGAQPGLDPQTASSHGDRNVSDSFTPKWQQKYQDRNAAALEKRLRKGGTGDSVKLGSPQVRPGRPDGHRPHLRRPRGVRRHPPLGVLRQHRGRACATATAPRALRRPAAQRDPEAGPDDGQLARCGRRTTTAATTRTCTSTG